MTKEEEIINLINALCCTIDENTARDLFEWKIYR